MGCFREAEVCSMIEEHILGPSLPVMVEDDRRLMPASDERQATSQTSNEGREGISVLPFLFRPRITSSWF